MSLSFTTFTALAILNSDKVERSISKWRPEPVGKIKDLSVSFISLVSAPATGKGLTLKSDNQNERFQVFELTKTDSDRMVAYGIVYAPNQVDSHGDEATEVAIRRAAYEFMREARLKNIDVEHNFKTEMAFVAESWLVRKGDALFPDEPAGAWAVGIQVGDPDLWEKLKSGELTGLSLAGIAAMSPSEDETQQHFTEKNDTPPKWFQSLVSGWMGKSATKPTEENEDMDAKEIREIVGDVLKSDLPDLIKAAIKAEGDAAPDTPPDGGEGAKTPDAAVQDAPVTKSDVEAIVKTAIGTGIEDAMAKALAKGALETGANDTPAQESFT